MDTTIAAQRLPPAALARLHLELLASEPIQLRCRICGAVWAPVMRPGGWLPSGWWNCPQLAEHPDHRPAPKG